MSCKVKGCARPDFVGGRCGFHAMQAWGDPKREAALLAAEPRDAAVAPQPRRRVVPRPASG